MLIGIFVVLKPSYCHHYFYAGGEIARSPTMLNANATKPAGCNSAVVEPAISVTGGLRFDTFTPSATLTAS